MASTHVELADAPFDYRSLSPAGITALADQAIAAADALISDAAAAATRREASFDEVIGRIDQAEGDVWTAGGQTAFLVRVHPDPELRTAAQAIEERLNAWRQGLNLRDDVEEAIRRFAESADTAGLTGEQRRLLGRWQRDLRRAGHRLPALDRDEVRAITDRVIVLESAFQRNLDEWTDGIDLHREDLVGLPDSYVARLGPGAAPGTHHVSLAYPDIYPFLQSSPRRDLREQLAIRMANRAVELNRPILEELLALRRRKAALLGYPSWSHFRIEAKMAGTPERVAAFHAAIFPPLQALAREEYAKMRQLLERETGETNLARWDTAYYDQRIRAEEYGVDHAELSAYLPLQATIDGILELTGAVFGLDYLPVTDAQSWHPDVPLFEVRDRVSAERLGWFYLDLHSRPGKFGHAMAWPVRLARRTPAGRVGGISAIVANVPRPSAADPGLLRHDDVVMLFHEFGHVLHEVLGTNSYHRLSMMGIEDDFPEAISQIMENWAWEPGVLGRFARNPANGQPMPAELAKRLAASRGVDLGQEYLRGFGGLGDFDLRVHGPEPVDLDEAKRAADAILLLPSIEGSFWPAAFAHIVADYDAGYYGYLWSLVYGDDLWSRFEAEGIIDPGVGAAYRRDVLEPGATRDAEDLVEAFLGRRSTNAAFLRRTGLGVLAASPA